MKTRLLAAGFWFALIWPGLMPFICPYPPFQDWPAHVGVIGALVHLDDPRANILQFYEYTGWFKLNMLFYLPAWALSELLGPDRLSPIGAANLCLAIALAGLGPSVWLLCRMVDADPRMAVLATPLALGRQVFCGFGPNAAALVLFVLALAAFFWARRGGPLGLATAGLTVVLVALASMHAFIFLAGAGLILLLALGDLIAPPRRAGAVALVGLLVSGVFFGVLFRQGLGVAGHAAGDPMQAIWQAILHAPRNRLVDTFWAWLFASYRYQRVDDLCQVGWAVAVAGAALVTWTVEGGRWWRTGRAALFGLAGVTVVMFVVLPENVGPPVNWWGARLRLPVLAALLVLPMIGRSVGREVSAFIAAAGLASTITVGLALYDLHRFHRTYGEGLSEVLDEVPWGQRVTFLHYTPRVVNEYPGQPFGYFGNFYLAHRGGVVPQDFFERRELPFHRRQTRPSPPWGLAAGFRWPNHIEGFDAVLLRTDPPASVTPFFGNVTKLELAAAAGGWRYYRVLTSP